MIGGDTMSIEKMLIQNHSAPKKQFTAQLDKNLVERFEKVSSVYGWGAKRRIIEYALITVLDELEKN